MKRIHLVCCCLGLSGSALLGQVATEVTTSEEAVAPSAAESEWTAVLAEVAEPIPLVQDGTDTQIRKSRSDAADILIERADLLETFADSHGNIAETSEARRLEAVTLITAEKLGNYSQLDRRRDVVGLVRDDPAVETDIRGRLAAESDNRDVARQSFPNREARMAEYERVARGLIKEFPNLDAPYDSLLRIGRDSGEAAALRIAQDLQEMAAPEHTRKAATMLAGRVRLVGQSPSLEQLLSRLADRQFPPVEPIIPDAGIIIYSWSAGDSISVAAARRLAEQTDSGALLVGICLDLDIAAAEAVATAESLPGIQLYDAAGSEGDLARQLFLTEPNLAYRLDGTGTVTSVNLYRELSSQLASSSAQP